MANNSLLIHAKDLLPSIACVCNVALSLCDCMSSHTSSHAASSFGGAGWRRVHSHRIKQSLDMLSCQIEKIQGERDSFRSILYHKEKEMQELVLSDLEVGWCDIVVRVWCGAWCVMYCRVMCVMV